MKIKDLTIVILRLYALMFFFDCLQNLYRFFANWYHPFSENGVFSKTVLINGFISIFLSIAVGTLLLKFSEKIAEWIVPAGNGESSIQVDSSSLMHMGLGLTGVIFTVRGLIQLGYGYSQLYFFPSDSLSADGAALSIEHKARIVESFISVMAGLLLFAGKERIAGLSHYFRTSTIATPEPENEPTPAEILQEDPTPKKPYRVYVVVDPLYGMYLRGVPADGPLWVVDSKKNHRVIQDLRKERNRLNQPEGITTFEHNPGGTPEDWLIAEMATIDLHHGGYAHDPPYASLEVIGTAWSNEIKEALKGYGFIKYERTTEGFIARREIGK